SSATAPTNLPLCKSPQPRQSEEACLLNLVPSPLQSEGQPQQTDRHHHTSLKSTAKSERGNSERNRIPRHDSIRFPATHTDCVWSGLFTTTRRTREELGATRALVVSDPGIIQAGHTQRGIDYLEAAGI